MKLENQCDGCQRGIPIGKNDYMGRKVHMAGKDEVHIFCTKDRYEPKEEKENTPSREKSIAEAIENDIHEILNERGLYDGGKNFLAEVNKYIIPRIKEARDNAYADGLNKGDRMNEQARISNSGRKLYQEGYSAAVAEMKEMVEKMPYPRGMYVARFRASILASLQTLTDTTE